MTSGSSSSFDKMLISSELNSYVPGEYVTIKSTLSEDSTIPVGTDVREKLETQVNSIKKDVSDLEVVKSDLENIFIVAQNKLESELESVNNDKDSENLYGFDARSVAQINKKMIDDVKVILAEYRLALKIYNAKREK